MRKENIYTETERKREENNNNKKKLNLHFILDNLKDILTN